MDGSAEGQNGLALSFCAFTKMSALQKLTAEGAESAEFFIKFCFATFAAFAKNVSTARPSGWKVGSPGQGELELT